MRETDSAPHPKAIERQRTTLWMLATSTLLGLVSLYPIIRGTRTDNHVMLLIGFVIALVSFKVLPVDKLPGLISAWKGRGE